MSLLTTLDLVPNGSHSRVKDIPFVGPLGRRLTDLGLIEGTVVQCVQRSPAGDPIAYLIRGAVIALRRADASRIVVEALG